MLDAAVIIAAISASCVNVELLVLDVSSRDDVVDVNTPSTFVAGRVNHTLPAWSTDRS